MALEFFIRNLCKEIIFECKKEDIECHNDFLNYYLTLLSYDPLWNLNPKMKLIVRNDALRLIRFVVAKMKHQECPCIIALKIHMYFNCNFKDKLLMISNERMSLKKRLQPLEDDIIDTRTDDKAEKIALRKKILYYITLWRGLGNPTNSRVYQEAYHAFHSIYDEGDLDDFMLKTNEEKLAELLQLAQIYSGVRIFNWTCKKGGEGIENLPNLLAVLVNEMNENIDEIMHSTMQKIDTLTSALECAFVVTEKTETVKKELIVTYNLECFLPDDVEYEDVEYIKDLLIVYRQLELLIRKLKDATNDVEKSVIILDKNFEECISHFHSLVYLKVGIPTNVVFPVFIDLDKIWENYQDEIIYIIKLKQILGNLQIYVKELVLNVDLLNSIIGDKEVTLNRKLEDVEYVSEDGKSSIDSNTQVLAIKLEYAGCCPWKLVETQGGLIPGNAEFGIMEYKEKCYVFSCVEASKSFYKAPDQFIFEALEIARKKPELISLLNLEDDLKAVQTIKELVIEQKVLESLVVTKEVNIQTDLHPTDTLIDPEYKWNLWDWKRQAICLADISKRATKSCQTESSSNKNPIHTQTYEQRENTTQTLHENYANTQTPQTYFFGLRGRNDSKQFILDLTRPIDQE